MSAYKIQTLGNYPEESIQHSEHGENLKSRNLTNFKTLINSFIFLQTHSLQFTAVTVISVVILPNKVLKLHISFHSLILLYMLPVPVAT